MTLPDKNCQMCLRLVEYRNENRRIYPDWHNAPVKSLGHLNAELYILGLAPGLKGANRTGIPFLGDHAGQLLYPTLVKFGFARRQSSIDTESDIQLINCRISNAVRCVPPKNKPNGAEIKECSKFLVDEIARLPNLKVILALGTIAHNSALGVYNRRRSEYKFSHNSTHDLGAGAILVDSYHCSRYNTNTGRLTEDMFYSVFKNIRNIITL